MLPSIRQLSLICLVWAVLAWYTVAVWAFKAGEQELIGAFTHYYALRAPMVGAVMGLLWSPIFALGYHPGRGRAGETHPAADDTKARHSLRFLRGAVLGQLVGASITFVLLFIWPNEMQNTRWDALKWAGVFWKLYWYLFVPAAAAAGALSVWMAVRHREREAR